MCGWSCNILTRGREPWSEVATLVDRADSEDHLWEATAACQPKPDRFAIAVSSVTV